MAYEIDYLQVGDGEKSGDAIAVRYGNLEGPRNEQTVIVIDGGTTETGESMVEHIKRWYGTDQVDYVISTHPDCDHASGLRTVLEEMNVGTLLMHRPWEHAGDIKDAFKDGRWTERGLGETFEKSIKYASELEEIADRKGIQIVEPFQGITMNNGEIQVLGPSVDFYQELVPQFRSTPASKTEGFAASILQKAQETVEWIQDAFDIDLLNDDEDTTSAENNTSVVVLLTVEGDHRLLFTGDAGKTALIKVADYADSLGIPLTNLKFLDVPHHGSRRNLSSKILKRVNGSTAFISASTGSSKHPSKKIVNALKKHGAEVFKTTGDTLLHRHESPNRGWGAAPKEPFYDQVEA